MKNLNNCFILGKLYIKNITFLITIAGLNLTVEDISNLIESDLNTIFAPDQLRDKIRFRTSLNNWRRHLPTGAASLDCCEKVACVFKMGPIKHLWTMRYESKHQTFKSIAKNITSRINVSYSLGVKASLKFTNFMKSEEIFSPSIIYHIETPKKKIVDLFSNIESCDLDLFSFAFGISGLKYNNILYREDHILHITKDQKTIFYRIIDFLIDEDQIEAYVVCQEIITSFLEHYFAYQYIKPKNKNVNILLISKFDGPPVKIVTLPRGEKAIKKKPYF